MASPIYQFAVSKSDSENWDYLSDYIFVGGAGDVAVVTDNGDVVTYTCVAGQILPVTAKRINSTNTDATNMVVLHSGAPVV